MDKFNDIDDLLFRLKESKVELSVYKEEVAPLTKMGDRALKVICDSIDFISGVRDELERNRKI